MYASNINTKYMKQKLSGLKEKIDKLQSELKVLKIPSQ